MKRDYELTFVVRPQTEDDGLKNVIERVRGWISADQGEVVKVDQWGRRRLAYPINKQREGVYVFMQVQLEPASLIALERNLGLSEDVLRYLVVRPDDAK
jgi:small subunit ribosomal protein S6